MRENDQLRSKLIDMKSEMLTAQKTWKDTDDDVSIRSYANTSVHHRTSISMQLSENKRLDELQKQIIMMKAKEKSFNANQRVMMDKMSQLQDALNQKTKNTQIIQKELQYSNRQVEDLKKELLQSELPTHQSKSHSYSYHY